jgi:hypothetical protein
MMLMILMMRVIGFQLRVITLPYIQIILMGSQPLIELYQLSRELFGNIIGSKNWIEIEFKNYEN